MNGRGWNRAASRIGSARPDEGNDFVLADMWPCEPASHKPALSAIRLAVLARTTVAQTEGTDGPADIIANLHDGILDRTDGRRGRPSSGADSGGRSSAPALDRRIDSVLNRRRIHELAAVSRRLGHAHGTECTARSQARQLPSVSPDARLPRLLRPSP